jgi:hypothetical protein
MGRFEEALEKWMWMALGIMILGVAALLILWFPFGRQAQELSLSRHRPQQKADLEDLIRATAPRKLKTARERLESLRASGEKRDPFLNRAELEWVQFVETLSLNVPRLEGILHREGEPYVMVRGKLLGIGDGVDGFLVEHIGEDYVEFTKEGRLLRVRLPWGGGKR